MIELECKTPSQVISPFVIRMKEIDCCRVKLWVLDALGKEVPFILHNKTSGISIYMDQTYAMSISSQISFAENSLTDIAWEPLSSVQLPLLVKDATIYLNTNSIPHSSEMKGSTGTKFTYKIGYTNLAVNLNNMHNITSVSAIGKTIQLILRIIRD
ncbi:MAG: hypothetical protein RSC43_00290 [Clostridia bacterium]